MESLGEREMPMGSEPQAVETAARSTRKCSGVSGVPRHSPPHLKDGDSEDREGSAFPSRHWQS